MPDKINSITELFADGSKFISVIRGQIEIEKLQKDLDSVGDWCKTWDMKLNEEKCKVMHFGKSNPKANYCMTDVSELNIEKMRLGYDLKSNDFEG